MPEHPKVEVLSDKAFRVLVDLWCWCSRNPTDGRVQESVWLKRTGSARVRRELTAIVPPFTHPLVESTGSGDVLVHDYLEHQRSAAEIAASREEKRRAGAYGNHVRWHVRKRRDPDCEHCIAEGSQPLSHMGSQVRSQPGSQPGSQHRSQNGRKPVADTDTDTDSGYVGGNVTEVDARATPPPKITKRRPRDRCAKHVGVADPPSCGGCADARRAVEAWEVAQAERKQALSVELARARADESLRCEHGTDGGLHVRSDTGKPLCPQCRRAAVTL